MLLAAVLSLPTPILWLRPDGAIVSPVQSRLLEGTKVVGSPLGKAFDFDGRTAAILFPDAKRLALTGSITVSTWLYLRSYVGSDTSYQNAEILFRGDDRSGLDPYHLTVVDDGRVVFGIQNAANEGPYVAAHIPLRQWVHVVGQYDRPGGNLRLWMDGALFASAKTAVVPFARLDKSRAPGMAIGNVQNPQGGVHHQPLNGILADLRLYDRVVSPTDAGFVPIGRE